MSAADIRGAARSWPLVGRAAELALAGQTLREGRFQALVLAGTPGVGKTRLAQEILCQAEEDGALVRWVWASPGLASMPLGAFGPLLPDLSGATRFELLGQITAHLEAIADGRRLLIGIDDAHRLDQTSVALVHRLVSTGAAFPVLTVRRGAPAPEPITALWKDGLAEQLEVSPLARAESNTLVTAALGGQVDGTTQHELFELSRGNVLFLRELVLGGLDTGSLATGGGVWRWNGPMTASPRLIELIETRLGKLSRPMRAALELVACGEPLPARLSDALQGDLSSRLEQLEGLGLIVADQIGGSLWIRLAHPLYGEVVRAGIPALWARALYRQLVDALGTDPDSTGLDLLRMATWRLAAGQPGDPGQLAAAANQALQTFDHDRAEELARAALRAGAGPSAHLQLATALARQGRSLEAETEFAAIPGERLDDPERVATAVDRAINLQWRLGRAADADAVLDHAIAQVADQSARNQLTAVKAAFLHYDLHCAQALRVLQPILDNPDTGRIPRIHALAVAADAQGATGRCEAAAATAKAAAELGDLPPPSDSLIALMVRTTRISSELWAGHLSDAHALAQAGYQQAIARHSAFDTAAHAGWLAAVTRAQGRLDVALSLNREAVECGRAQEVRTFRRFLPRLLAELAQTAAMFGEVTAAQDAIDEATALDNPPSRILDLWAHMALPWISAARGATSHAVELCFRLADRAAELGLITFELMALHDAIRFDPTTDVADRINQLIDSAEGPLAAGYAQHARALAARDGAALDRAAQHFADLGAKLLAAETAAHAALTHRAQGATTRALASATRARGLAANLGAVRTPPMKLLSAPPALTPRELEIAELAAHGHTSKDIAEHLVISVRTVDNALHEVYTKLGINRRGELAQVLGNPPKESSN